jgi:hypothetical protein
LQAFAALAIVCNQDQEHKAAPLWEATILPTNIKLVGLLGKNTLAYLPTAVVAKKNTLVYVISFLIFLNDAHGK